MVQSIAKIRLYLQSYKIADMGRFNIFAFAVLLLISCNKKEPVLNNTKLLSEVGRQLKTFNEKNKSDSVPRSFSDLSGFKMVGHHDWTCGFPAGTFWLMYDLTKDEYWKEAANRSTIRLEGVQNVTGTHDLGFMVNCSSGNGLRLTGDTTYRNRIITASENLIKRFNPTVGCIRSWDFGPWQYPVIIDNMMNLEMLFSASKLTGNPVYRDIAVTHANTTLRNHFRDNFSSFHVVDYDTLTGLAIGKYTHQGLNDSSAWGRGQAWGLYGFTVCFRETGDSAYLQAADKIASFILKSLPEDKIAYWDFDDPKIPGTFRDASAAAIMASAFYELSGYSANGKEYRKIADTIVAELSSDKYRVSDGSNGGFILKHSVGNLPGNSEIDVAINYADYYYVEALKRKNQKK